MYDQLNLFDLTYPSYKITKPIRLITLFSGYDSQALALKYLNINFEHYRTCEWAINSIEALHDIHFSKNKIINTHTQEELVDLLFNLGISKDYNKPMEKSQINKLGYDRLKHIYQCILDENNMVNISSVKSVDLGIIDKDKYEYIMTYSFPCITEDSLILTKEGYKEYKDIQVGEYVLTKSNTWQKVVKKFDNGVHETYYLQGMGFENIHCTSNHKFYVREKFRKGCNQIRCFKNPEFKEVKNITKNDYFGVPVIQEEEHFYKDDLDFWYMIGYYLGDGWLNYFNKDIILTCNKTKLKKLKAHLDVNKWHYTYNFDSTCYKLRFSNKEIYNFISTYIGTGSFKKRICGEILRLPKIQLNSLIEGYIDSDGSRIKKYIQFSSVNRELIYGISIIINKVYHRATSIYKNIVSPTKVIDGGIVNQHDFYLLRFKPINDIQDRAFYENGYIWYPFSKLKKGKEEHVYNMEIENDHSYIVQNCISKNCQDLSLAGKQLGMEEGSNTRSSLLWQVKRILEECKNNNSLPQVLIMENVPQVISMKGWREWNEFLEKIGYSNYTQVLNAIDYGIPQSRKRAFMVSLLGEYSYKFPKPFKLEYKKNDFLDSNVEEKYYLTNKQIDDIKKWKAQQNCLDTINKTICPTITTRVGAYCASMILTIDNKSKNLWTNTEKQMITDDLNVKRYLNSNKVDEFKDGQFADISFPNGYNKGNRVFNIMPTINCTTSKSSFIVKDKSNIRKLISKEIFRFMGVKDIDYEKINQTEQSKYHLAGDSIVVQVLMGIFGELLPNCDYENKIKESIKEIKKL